MPTASAPLLLIAAAAIIGVAVGVALPQAPESVGAPPTSARSPASVPPAPSDRARFTICRTGGGTNCVVDGDTAWIDGVKVRVADIDAPETHPPRCQSEADLGDRATLRLAELMNKGPFEQARIDRNVDRYGRRLRILIRHGRSLGDVLVAEGLART